MDVVMEVLVADDARYLLSHALHFGEDLFELCDELVLGWLERHSIGSETDNSVDTVLLLLFVHLVEDQVSALLVDDDLRLDNHVVDEADESTETLVISASELQHSVFERILLLHEHHGFVLGSLTHLCMLKIFLFLERTRLAHTFHESVETLRDDVVNFGAVMALDIAISLALLLRDELRHVHHLGCGWNAEGLLGLHLEQVLADVEECGEEGRSNLDEVPRKTLPGSVVSLESHVAFPKLEHFADKVVLEEVHACQHVEQS